MLIENSGRVYFHCEVTGSSNGESWQVNSGAYIRDRRQARPFCILSMLNTLKSMTNLLQFAGSVVDETLYPAKHID
jgi:hypothetical protein